jgi:AcrR family transcriptional regulator
MARPKQSEQKPDLALTIQEAAWAHIAKWSAAALSLRAIARQLGITAPAIYNYYPTRAELVTALIVSAYTSLGDSQRAVLNEIPPANLPDRFKGLGMAYRQWAITYPQRYQLIFGTPIAGYSAPEDRTVPAASWALQPLIQVLQDLFDARMLVIQHLPPQTPALEAMLKTWGSIAGGFQPEVLYLALIIWSRVHGLVSLEIGGQMPSVINDPGEIFQREILYYQKTYIQS